MSSDADKRVKVVVRIRPRLERERYETICGRKVDDSHVSLITDSATAANPQATTMVDACFDEQDNQQTVYEDVAQEFVDHALDGCNATIFAYGQTGAGKTHTILGNVKDGGIGEHTGIFLRVFDDLFNYQRGVRNQRHVIIALSAIELHIEDVLDLLNTKNPIKIRERGDDVLLPGVRSYTVTSMAEVLNYFEIANSFRSVTQTAMNDASSRSHAIFLIDVFCIPVGAQYPVDAAPVLSDLIGADGSQETPKGITRSRISLVDLAGSERVKKSKVEGAALAEANAINKSLSTLRTVIHAMYTSSGHIPYRDSKLTKLLRPAFTDPTSRLLLIGQISPCSASHSESTGTIKFCDEVKGLKVATQSPYIDPEEEASYLATLRQVEELSADFRIAATTHFHKPVGIGRLVKKAEGTGMSKDGVIQQVLPNLKQQAAFAAQAEDQKMRLEVEHKVKMENDELVVDYSRRRLHAEESVHELVNQAKELNDQIKGDEANQEKEKEKKTSEAKRIKKSRLNATEQLDKVKEQLKQCQAEKAAAAASKKAPAVRMPGDLSPEEMEADETWEEFEEDWHVSECNHHITADFYKYFCENTTLRTEVITQLTATEQAWSSVSQARTEASTATLGSLPADVIHFAIDRCVDIVEGMVDARDSFTWFDVRDSSKRLRPSSTWPQPLKVSLEGGMPPVLVADPSTTTVLSDDEDSGAPATTTGGVASGLDSRKTSNVTSATASVNGADAAGGELSGGKAGAGSKPKKEKKAKKSAMQKKFESQEADKKYLMGVYDSRTLVSDVLRYLGSGSIMMKHGRSGAPHKRKFWFNNSTRELSWIDADLPATEAKKTSILLTDVTSIVLGPFSKVFKRNPPPISDLDYWRSFTLTTRDSSRDSLDMVASSLVDFEAWVLGLSHLCHLDPHWGKTLETKLIAEQPETPLSDEEMKLCLQTHLMPSHYAKIRDAVTAHRDEVSKLISLFAGDADHAFEAVGGIHLPQVNHKGAILMTKGELRYYCNTSEVDIFRVCEIWKFFASKSLIFDPSFTPATNFGVKTKRN